MRLSLQRVWETLPHYMPAVALWCVCYTAWPAEHTVMLNAVTAAAAAAAGGGVFRGLGAAAACPLRCPGTCGAARGGLGTRCEF
jgi:hypothetical protein